MDARQKKRPPQHLSRSEPQKTKKIARPGRAGGAKQHTRAPEAPRRTSAAPGRSEKLFRETLLPKLEQSHQANQMGLRIGVIWLFALPVLLAVIRRMTDSSKVAFLLIWIVGMFLIAGVLVFVAYSDSELKRTLGEVKAHLPEASDAELGELVDLAPLRAELSELRLTPEELRELHRRRSEREGGGERA